MLNPEPMLLCVAELLFWQVQLAFDELQFWQSFFIKGASQNPGWLSGLLFGQGDFTVYQFRSGTPLTSASTGSRGLQ